MTIKFRFVTGNDVISNAIRAGEYGFWATHVEALMPDGTLLGAHTDGGVQARPLGYDAGMRTQELLVELPATDSQERIFGVFLTSQLGRPYDHTAIAGLVLGRNWRERDSWFCSELQAAALEQCGWFEGELAEEVNHITPRDLLLILTARVAIPTRANTCS